MKLILNYSELRDYITDHYHVNASFARIHDDEICVSFVQKMFIKTIQINLNLHVEEICNDSITLSYDNGIGIDMIISGVLLFLKKKFPEYDNLISAIKSNMICIHLKNIEKLQSILETVELNNIRFTESSMEIEMGFK